MSAVNLDLFKIRVLAIDPGLDTGWAAFNDDGFPFATGLIREPGGLKEANMRTHIDWFRKLKRKPQTIVIEQFRVKPTGEMNGKRVVASEVIGIVRTYAVLNEIELVVQENTCIKMGLLYARIKMPTVKIKTHVPSAIAHGTYYVVGKGIRTAPVAGLRPIDPTSAA